MTSVDGYLGFFHFLAIVNSAIMNMSMQVSLQDPALDSFRYTPRSGIAGLSLSVWAVVTEYRILGGL